MVRRLRAVPGTNADPGAGVQVRHLPDGQISSSVRCPLCPALARKIFRLTRRANQPYNSRRLVPTRGALRGRHGRWARDAVDADALVTNGAHADGEVVWS